MNRDSYGTAWFTDGPNGRIPVDPEREFGRDWPGHAGHEDDWDTTA
jgi:hypothetical protein